MQFKKNAIFSNVNFKVKKSILSVLLAVLLCFLNITHAFALVPYANSEFAATLDIVSYPAGNTLSSDDFHVGHSFLVVHNYNSYPITVGHMTVPSLGTVTVSVFNNRSSHQGVWYNIEGYRSSAINSVSAAKLSTGLTEADLNTLNSYINDWDYYNYVTNYCTSFSIRCWNAVVPHQQIGGATPATLYQNIINSGGSTSVNVPNKSINAIAYQTATSVQYDPSGAYDDK